MGGSRGRCARRGPCADWPAAGCGGGLYRSGSRLVRSTRRGSACPDGCDPVHRTGVVGTDRAHRRCGLPCAAARAGRPAVLADDRRRGLAGVYHRHGHGCGAADSGRRRARGSCARSTAACRAGDSADPLCAVVASDRYPATADMAAAGSGRHDRAVHHRSFRLALRPATARRAARRDHCRPRPGPSRDHLPRHGRRRPQGRPARQRTGESAGDGAHGLHGPHRRARPDRRRAADRSSMGRRTSAADPCPGTARRDRRAQPTAPPQHDAGERNRGCRRQGRSVHRLAALPRGRCKFRPVDRHRLRRPPRHHRCGDRRHHRQRAGLRPSAARQS